MSLDKNLLKSVVDKKYTDFEKAVKQELNNKLANHPVSKQYVSDYDKIQQMKDSFAKITKTKDSEKEESEPEEK